MVEFALVIIALRDGNSFSESFCRGKYEAFKKPACRGEGSDSLKGESVAQTGAALGRKLFESEGRERFLGISPPKCEAANYAQRVVARVRLHQGARWPPLVRRVGQRSSTSARSLYFASVRCAPVAIAAVFIEFRSPFFSAEATAHLLFLRTQFVRICFEDRPLPTRLLLRTDVLLVCDASNCHAKRLLRLSSLRGSDDLHLRFACRVSWCSV